ncbi:dispersed gene family protein 1 (DGF-1), putative [Trypanosoma cruzi]|nr:dispersed gene family protein 1 (DGF-1), putative [Trypanosoma cruzi]
MGLLIRGSGARVHVNVTSSMLDSGALEFEGDFGVSSQIMVAGSTLVTKSVHAVAFYLPSLGANSTLLLLDNYIGGNRYAVHFSIGVVDGGRTIVKGNTLTTTEEDGVESSVCVCAVLNDGYIDVENNTMSAVNGVYLFGDTVVISAGLLRVADSDFVAARSFGFRVGVF